MKIIQKFLITLPVLLIVFLVCSFTTDKILSKLKSLSYLIRLVDRYYVEEVQLDTEDSETLNPAD